MQMYKSNRLYLNNFIETQSSALKIDIKEFKQI